MRPSIDKEYISNAVGELIKLLGVKENIPQENVLKPLNAGRTTESLEQIASYLGLPIKVKVSYSEIFESRSLSTTDETGRGMESISAQVSIPGNLPLYGTNSLVGFPINVKVGGDYLNYPETFVAIMAHELSHIVLHSLSFGEKDNEYYTDIAAMILGFSEIIQSGRKVVKTRDYNDHIETTTTRCGYLSDEHFDFAYRRIAEVRKMYARSYIDLKKKCRKKLISFMKQISHYKKELFLFQKYVKYLDKHQNKRFRKDDATKIVQFHQIGYADNLIDVLRKWEEKLREVNERYTGFVHKSWHYTKPTLVSLRALHEVIDGLTSDLKNQTNSLATNTRVTGRYVGMLEKLNIKKQAHFSKTSNLHHS